MRWRQAAERSGGSFQPPEMHDRRTVMIEVMLESHSLTTSLHTGRVTADLAVLYVGNKVTQWWVGRTRSISTIFAVTSTLIFNNNTQHVNK